MTRRMLIGELEIDPATRRLRRRGGDYVHLAKRPFQVLLYLIANRDRLVTRAELLEQFWGGRHVYEDAMTRCMSSVRKALGERSGAPRYIETRWAEGYRYVGPYREIGRVPIHARGTAPAAERLLQRGYTYLSQSGSGRSFRYALEMLRQASALAPEDPRAHAGIAACRALLHIFAEPTAEHRAAALAASNTSLEIDRDCAEAQLGRALVAVMEADHATADEAFREAEQRDPSRSYTWYYHGRCCAARGEHERALTYFMRAVETDPDHYLALALSVASFERLGLHADRRRAARECVAAAERALQREPDDVRAISLAASVLPDLGRHEEAVGLTARAAALEPNEIIVNVNAARVYVAAGDYDRAACHLRRLQAVAHGTYLRQWLAHDPCLDPVRTHPKFHDVLPRPTARARSVEPRRLS